MAGLSGVAVGVTAAGGVLMYAGLRGVSPAQALKDVLSGKPPAVPKGNIVGAVGGALHPGTTGGGGSAVGGRLVTAAYTHAGERYSQARRWQKGYSDCSSFVGKSFKDIGITPPGPSVTWAYQTWSKLRKINRSQLAAGDLCGNFTHIIMATGNNSAIGQQNDRENVQTGTPEGLMSGTGSFICMRYVG